MFKLAEVVVWLDPEKITSDVFRIADIEGSGKDARFILENEFSEVEVSEHEIWKPKDVRVCKQCGNFHPQIRAFVDINTNSFIDYVEESPIWCDQCDSQTNTITANKFYLDRIVKLKT